MNYMFVVVVVVVSVVVLVVVVVLILVLVVVVLLLLLVLVLVVVVVVVVIDVDLFSLSNLFSSVLQLGLHKLREHQMRTSERTFSSEKKWMGVCARPLSRQSPEVSGFRARDLLQRRCGNVCSVILYC